MGEKRVSGAHKRDVKSSGGLQNTAGEVAGIHIFMTFYFLSFAQQTSCGHESGNARDVLLRFPGSPLTCRCIVSTPCSKSFVKPQSQAGGC